MTSVAFITPSFTPDLERCALLVDSIRHFAPDITHYLLVDKRDIPAFRHLASPRTIIVPSEEIMHKSYRRIPGGKGFWFNLRTPPVRGWITQQLRKLGATSVTSEDILVCLDSDITFVRPFDVSQLYDAGKLTLLDVDYTDDMVLRWTRVAERLLNLPAGSVPLRGHVGSLIIWSRADLLKLQAHLERENGVPWQVAIGRQITFSEYILYGVFVREVLGYPASDHVASRRPLVRQPWQHDLGHEAGLRSYIEDIEPGNIAVMIHSKDGITARQTRPLFEAAWARTKAAPLD